MKVEINSPFADEKKQIGIDFDGVIHKCSKGYHDGTVYDDPILGSLEALKHISSQFTIIIYSAKARSDRPLVNGKTGIELIWEWLAKHGFKEYVQDVTAEKPRAFCYIDDRAIRFTDWETTRQILNDYLVISK